MSSETPPDKNSDSSSDDFTKHLDYIQASTKSVTNFIYWLAKLFVTKNWVSLLSLVDVGLLIFFRPEGGVITGLLSGLPVFSGNYDKFFWLIFWVILLVALIIAIRIMPRPASTLPDFTERKAIKGLRAFSQDDAEIFAQLQREKDIRKCLALLTNDNFRFGILKGESGVGKSSFLQAGILPQLGRKESYARGIYIRFRNRDPFETIYYALVEELKFSKTPNDQQNLLEIFSLAVASADKPLILIFDQFEQFFVHCKQKSSREPFINSLKDWYRAPNPLPIKILISIREDLEGKLYELQEALDYHLSVHFNYQKLEQFSPEQATEILKVIAEAEPLEFDEDFVRQLTEEELASGEDDSISPVDLQVLAWIINQQKSKELQAFNRNAFQKLGGIEGLMKRFLNEALEARGTESKKQAAIKVLLAMTDLDHNIRVGALTIEDLQQKMQGTLPASEIREATLWLADPRVRLLTTLQRGGNLSFELTHDKLIPALRELAGKELTSTSEANQLLDSRVNEWLGNEYNPYYLLNWQQLQLIQQQKPFLVWGTNKSSKEKLLQLSWKRLRLRLVAFGMVMVFSLVGIIWWYSPLKQIRQVRNELQELSKKVSYDYTQKAILAFAKDSSFEQAFEIFDSIQDSEERDESLSAIVETYIKLEKTAETEKYLERILTIDQQILDSSDKAYLLFAIFETYVKSGNTAETEKYLERILTIDQQILDSSDKAYLLFAIFETYIKLEKTAEVQKYLEQTIDAAEQIPDSYFKAQVLQAIARAIVRLGNTIEGQKYLEQSITAIGQNLYSYYKADLLTTLAEKYIKIEPNYDLNYIFYEGGYLRNFIFGDETEPQRYLEQTIAAAEQIANSKDKAAVLLAIAEIIGKLENFSKAKKYLSQAITSTEEILDLQYKSQVLTAITKTQAKLDRWREAHNAVSLCPTDECKVESLSLILTAWAEKKHPELKELTNEN